MWKSSVEMWGNGDMYNMRLMNRHDFRFDYDDKAADYTMWVQGDVAAIQTIILLGTVQIGHLPRWVAESCPPGTAVVQGAPHWLAADDGHDIPDRAVRFTADAVDNVLRLSSATKLAVVAESQAVPGIIELACRTMEHFRAFVFVQPLGFTTEVYAPAGTGNVRLLKQRLRQNGRQQLGAILTDSRVRYSYHVLRTVVEPDSPVAAAHYGVGLAHDAIPGLKHIVDADCEVSIVCGAKDKIFPPSEVLASLKKNDIAVPVTVVSGVAHTSMATHSGRKLLAAALDIIG